MVQREQGTKPRPKILKAFAKIDCLSVTLKLSRLDEGEGMESTFGLHKAKWHDSCRLQFNKTKLQRAEKRKCLKKTTQNQDIASSPV